MGGQGPRLRRAGSSPQEIGSPWASAPGFCEREVGKPWWRAGLHRLQGGEVNGAQQGSRSHQERQLIVKGADSSPVKYGQEVPSLAEIIRRIEAAKKKIDLLRQVMRK